MIDKVEQYRRGKCRVIHNQVLRQEELRGHETSLHIQTRSWLHAISVLQSHPHARNLKVKRREAALMRSSVKGWMQVGITG